MATPPGTYLSFSSGASELPIEGYMAAEFGGSLVDGNAKAEASRAEAAEPDILARTSENGTELEEYQSRSAEFCTPKPSVGSLH